VTPDNIVNSSVVRQLARPATLRFLADRLGQANVQIRLGAPTTLPDGSPEIVPSGSAVFQATLAAPPTAGQSREPIFVRKVYHVTQNQLFDYAVEVTLSDPYTFKATTLRDVAGLLFAIGVVVLGLAFILASC
jgi:hypothetical protein